MPEVKLWRKTSVRSISFNYSSLQVVNMFQNNPLLAQLKQQLRGQTPHVEGTIKGTDKGFGFLEVDQQKSYFIPPQQMKKVMHGDKIKATLHTDKNREIAEPEELIEPFLTRFVGQVQKHAQRLSIIVDHPSLIAPIPCRIAANLSHNFEQGDWVVAELRHHPLQGSGGFNAEIVQFITQADDFFAPWWVTLSRYELEKSAPEADSLQLLADEGERIDLIHLPFITIDGPTTEDMDDALCTEENADGSLTLWIAIADPTAYIAEDSELDLIARQRAFTNYLPAFDIPMLPRELANNLCSLRTNERRSALVCRVTVTPNGELKDDIQFLTAWVQSKAKLVYDNVSDWLENCGLWLPENEVIAQQIRLLQLLTDWRAQWRKKNALIFKERPDYRFTLNDQGKVLNIVVESRRIANRMVEEAMITANLCAARVLSRQLGFGIFNAHPGFDPSKVDQVVTILKNNGIEVDGEALLTLDGFRQLRRQIDLQPTSYLDNRIRRCQTYADLTTLPQPHFGLGFDVYATWTSPIRKYGDMVNHRLLKALIVNRPIEPPKEEIIIQLAERRRLNRMAEREVSDWLYARYLAEKIGAPMHFKAEIFDISRGGMRARLLDNGAMVFIPAPFIHAIKNELVCNQEHGTILINGTEAYRLGDTLDLILTEVRMDTRSIIARPAV